MSYKSIGLEIGGDAIIGGARIAEIPSRRPKINAVAIILFIFVHPSSGLKFACPLNQPAALILFKIMILPKDSECQMSRRIFDNRKE
jgi:hypothetical protein